MADLTLGLICVGHPPCTACATFILRRAAKLLCTDVEADTSQHIQAVSTVISSKM